MDASPFARLPPELRTLIFEHALTQPHPLQITDNPTAKICPQTENKPQHVTALPQTSRQLYTETSHLLYTLNTFHLRKPSTLPAFLDQIGPHNAYHLRSLRIDVPGYVGYFGQDIHYFRSVVKSIARRVETHLSGPCEVVVWPVMLADRRQYSETEFEAFMELLQLDVRDVEGSLRRAIEGAGERMKGEERQGVWRDLFWARRLFGEYLSVEEGEGETKVREVDVRDADGAQRCMRVV